MATPDRELVTCPFVPSHRVERYKLQGHIEKCKKQFLKSTNKVTCPFDATHVVAEDELQYHVEHCPKRAMFDTVQYEVDDGAKFTPSAVPVPSVSAEEDWDTAEFASYQPGAKKESIIKKVKGATPSERRKARMEGVRTYKPE